MLSADARILLTLATAVLILGTGAVGPCSEIEVKGVATISVEGSVVSLRWKNSRPDASGVMTAGANSYTGHVNFPDDRKYTFNFYPEEETIYWDGDKGKTTNIWRNAKCLGLDKWSLCTRIENSYASIAINDGGPLTLQWKNNRRPNANGVINQEVSPHTGSVNFPDDKVYTFNFYPEEETIYWDGDKGATTNIWKNTKCVAPQWLSCTVFSNSYARINMNDDKTVTLRWKSSGRPNALGEINRRMNPHTGSVNFPDDKRYTFFFYPEEETIYWDGDKGSTRNIWRNVKCEA